MLHIGLLQLLVIMSYSRVVKEEGGGGGEGEAYTAGADDWTTIIEKSKPEDFGNSLPPTGLAAAPTTANNGEKDLLTAIANYIQICDSSSMKDDGSQKLYFVLRHYIHDILNRKNYYKNKNNIEIEFCPNNTFIIKGNKDKYGALIGPKRSNLNYLLNRYKGVTINIPNRDDTTNKIIVKGDNGLNAVFDIIKKIKPQFNS